MGLPAEALWSSTEVAPLDVWPENWPAVQLLLGSFTQWTKDFNGNPTGLNYAGLERVERALGLRGRRAREAFAGLQVLEAEWLQLDRAKRGNKG